MLPGQTSNPCNNLAAGCCDEHILACRAVLGLRCPNAFYLALPVTLLKISNLAYRRSHHVWLVQCSLQLQQSSVPCRSIMQFSTRQPDQLRSFIFGCSCVLYPHEEAFRRMHVGNLVCYGNINLPRIGRITKNEEVIPMRRRFHAAIAVFGKCVPHT